MIRDGRLLGLVTVYIHTAARVEGGGEGRSEIQVDHSFTALRRVWDDGHVSADTPRRGL